MNNISHRRGQGRCWYYCVACRQRRSGCSHYSAALLLGAAQNTSEYNYDVFLISSKKCCLFHGCVFLGAHTSYLA